MTLAEQFTAYAEHCKAQNTKAGLIVFDADRGVFFHCEALYLDSETLKPMQAVASDYVSRLPKLGKTQ